MDNTLIEDKTRLLNSGIAYLRHTGYQDIRASKDGFKKPRSIFNLEDKEGYTPDVIASKSLATYIFEVLDQVPEEEEREESMARWQTFDEYAKKKSGKFYFITYHKVADEMEKIFEESEIEPGYIRIKR